jgi:sugar phosphate isomerase/epimerase
MEYAVFPYLPENRRGGPDVYHKFAEELNTAGKRAHHAGLKLCYHNHAFEFKPMGSVAPLQILMKETDPSLLSLEMDVFWVSVAGHDPVVMLTTYAGRVALVHLKDKPAGFPVQYNEHVPASDFKEVGSGSINFRGVLRAAAQANVKHFFVEQDHTPGDPLASLRKSYEYLHGLQF